MFGNIQNVSGCLEYGSKLCKKKKKCNKYSLILCVGFTLDTIKRKTSLANDSHSHELSIVKPMFHD